jgi:hypothetical protein
MGLAVAWASGWTTTDLVWSLWLSSLVVGYAMIVWSIVQPVLELGAFAWNDRTELRRTWAVSSTSAASLVGVAAAAIAFGLFLLAFFTVHFGGFHYIHSQFLISLFPLGGESRVANLPTYLEVVSRYWLALPSAFLAERSAFLRRTFTGVSAAPDLSVSPEAIARRKAANARRSPSRMMAPYQKVMRMHVLIIALGAAHAARLDSFGVYALVYALYFFPWRLLRPRAAASASTAITA